MKEIRIREITEIVAYQLSNGTVSTNKVEAVLAQTTLDIQHNVDELVDTKCWSGMTKSDVVDFVMENRKELLACLTLGELK